MQDMRVPADVRDASGGSQAHGTSGRESVSFPGKKIFCRRLGHVGGSPASCALTLHHKVGKAGGISVALKVQNG